MYEQIFVYNPKANEILTYEEIWDSLEDLADDNAIAEYLSNYTTEDIPYFGSFNLSFLYKLYLSANLSAACEYIKYSIFRELVEVISDNLAFDDDFISNELGLYFCKNKQKLIEKFL